MRRDTSNGWRHPALGVVLGLAAAGVGCAGRVPPDAVAPAARPGADCVTSCVKQYKDCAYGSECMMVPECDMEICIPARQDCEARCAETR